MILDIWLHIQLHREASYSPPPKHRQPTWTTFCIILPPHLPVSDIFIRLQETMSSWMIPKPERWMHGRKLVLAWPAVWKQIPKSGRKRVRPCFSVRVKYENPWLSFKHQYSWVNLVLGTSRHWVHPKAIPFGTGHVSPTADAKAMYDCGFLEGTGNCKLPFDFPPFAIIPCMDSKEV